MPTLKLTITSSSSSSIYANPQFHVDKWVRRISNNPTSNCKTSMGTPLLLNKVAGIRAFTASCGSTVINGKSREQVGLGVGVGWRRRRDGFKSISPARSHFGSNQDKGSARNWDFGRRRSLSSESKGLVPKMNSESREEEEDHHDGSKLLTLPTILTLARVAAVPLLVSTFYMTSWWATTVTTSIFVAAAVTDWLDGYLARKMRLGTAFGAFLDPVADKLMVAATLVLLCTRPVEVAAFGDVPWLIPVPAIAIIGREVTMSAVREWAASQDSKVLEAVAVNNLGKWKTATQMTALTILLATRDSSLTGSGVLAVSGVALLYISAGLAVWSLAVYIKGIWRILVK